MRRFAILLAALALSCAVSAQEQSDVTIEVEPETVILGEVFTATVRFTLPADHEAIIPGEDADLGGAEVRGMEESSESLEDGSKRHEVTYMLALWKLGEVVVKTPAIASRGPDGEVEALESAEATVTVESILPEGAQDIRDIRGPRVIPLRWYHYALAALPVLGVLGLVALLVWWLRWRSREQEAGAAVAPPLPPAEEALAALRELESEDLVGRGLIKEHYVRLSWILRNYLERRWDLPALEETTGMLRHTMLGSGRVPEDVVGEITAVLSRADLAKFARHRPQAATARADIDEVREIVRATRRREEEVAEGVAPDAAVASPAS